jgi:nicotinate-nucleotide pyrophosphorylase (carboxylating)
VKEVFKQLSPLARVAFFKRDGDAIRPQEKLCECVGPAWALLAGERTALNFLGLLCGVATLTAKYVSAAGGRIKVYDTRKTLPGLRLSLKYAVRQGGGYNHRMNLASAILLKDNHLALAGSLSAACAQVRKAAPRRPIEVEVETLAQLEEALAVGPETILLDNFSPAKAAAAVRRIAGRSIVEVSGGITLRTLPAYSRTGADRVSVGALTHSAPNLPLHMEFAWR